MSFIRVAEPRLIVSPDGGEHTVSAAIDFNATPLTLWFRLQSAAADCRAESFISALLLPAMAQQLPIECAGAVSELYLRQLDTVREIFATWFSTFHRVPVRAPTRPAEPPGPDAAAFFTGGVDSFLEIRDVDQRADLAGMGQRREAPPESAALQAEIAARLRAVAAAMGTELLVVGSNLRARSTGAGHFPRGSTCSTSPSCPMKNAREHTCSRTCSPPRPPATMPRWRARSASRSVPGASHAARSASASAPAGSHGASWWPVASAGR